MPAVQKLLFADPRPLVERLGREFFRRLPESAGVYLMRDSNDVVLYVGKAKNLRKRLGSYRVANPERLARRHLRLLRAVAKIEIQESADERAALAREAELLLALRPRFNRAGTWSPPPQFLGFRMTGEGLELAVVSAAATGVPARNSPSPSLFDDGRGPKARAALANGAAPATDGCWHGPHGAGAKFLRNALARLLWFALYPARGVLRLPVGWFRGSRDGAGVLRFSGLGTDTLAEVSRQLALLFAGRSDNFTEWVLAKTTAEITPFEKALLEGDLEFLNERFGRSHADASGLTET